MKIWALGDAVVDLLPVGDMRYQACAGGAPFNVAVGAARLACDTAFIGRVGDDQFGRFLQKHWKNRAWMPDILSVMPAIAPVQ